MTGEGGDFFWSLPGGPTSWQVPALHFEPGLGGGRRGPVTYFWGSEGLKS